MKETVFGGNIMWSKIRLCSHNTLRPFKPARKPGGLAFCSQIRTVISER